MILGPADIAARFGPDAAGRIAGVLESEPARTVMGVLNGKKIETRIVGGAVRNALAGCAGSDIDCATSAPPDAVIARAEAAGLTAVPTGIDHGTVTLVCDGRPVEVTTLRTDVATDGRRATVAFDADWQGDAARRDFTVNALYLDADGSVHDPLGGAGDIAGRRIRFIGDASRRIAEDYLRILRFFRFLATFEGSADPDALPAIVAALSGLETLSAERVRKELLLLCGAADPVPALELMQAHGVLTAILASAPVVPRVARLLALEAALAQAPDALSRFAALSVHVTEDAARLGHRLRLSNAECKQIAGAFDGWWRLNPLSEAAIKEAAYRLGSQTCANRLLVAWLHTAQPAPDETWRAAFALVRGWQPPRFPVSGKDLVGDSGKPGPQIGARLKALESRWIESGFTLSREELLAEN